MNSALKDRPDTENAPLPRRDWILLPVVSVLTIILMLGLAEWTARRRFESSNAGYERCEVLDDPATGVRGIPNSVCWEKAPESSWIQYRFNRCGHRAGMECGPKVVGTYRIVMTGSSVAFGQFVRQEESFAALLPKALAERTRRQVELYNEGMGFGFSHSVVLRFKEVLAAQPDLILWVVTPPDISRGAQVLPGSIPDPGLGSSFLKREWRRLQMAVTTDSLQGAAATLFRYSKTDMMVRHFLYESQSETLKVSVKGPDDEDGYLKAELSTTWQGYLKQFEHDAADIEGQAVAAGIPFAAVYTPTRTQAAMVSVGNWTDGLNPYTLNNELRSIVTRNGGIYVNILPDFQSIPNPELDYFPVDGHPNEKGHELLAALLAKELTNGSVPALRAVDLRPLSAMGR